eukprot:13663378-Alexandrium_andersonii.AAC.1
MRWAWSCGASWCASMRLPSSRSSSASSKSAGRARSDAGAPPSFGPGSLSGRSGGAGWRS